MQEQEQPQKPQPSQLEQRQQVHQQREEEREQGRSFGAAVHLPTLLGSSHAKPYDEESAAAKATTPGLVLPHLLPGRSKRSSSAEAQAEEEPQGASSSAGNMLGTLVQKIVAGFDDSLLGVKVHIDSMKLEPLSGIVEVHGLKVDNPKGFRSAYLLRAGKVVIRVNATRLISSLGSSVEIDEIDLEGMDVIYEKSLRTSNLRTLLEKVEGSEVGDKGAKPSGQEDNSLQLTLHKIAVRSVGAKVCTSLSTMVGPRLSVGDINYEDFDKTSGGAKGLMQVVRLILATLLKSILASILGKSASDGVARAASGVTHIVSHALHESKAALSHVRPHATPGGEGTAEEVQPPARTWCGYAAPWSCCQGVVHQEEGEIEVSQ